MPEWALAPYVAMRPRIEAERELALYAAVLAAGGRHMDDAGQREYVASLRRAAEGDSPAGRPRVKPTAGFIREMQAAAKRSGGR